VPLRLSTELSMADLWTGFDLNEPGTEDDDDAAAAEGDEVCVVDGEGERAALLASVLWAARRLQSRSPTIKRSNDVEKPG